MTTQDLGPGPMKSHPVAPDLGSDLEDSSPDVLGSMFESSPARDVQTSAAAETAFVLGLSAVLAAPFELTTGLAVGLAGLALVLSVVGLARASRPRFTGGLLASIGLVLGLATLALVGLRYAGVDTTFGEALLPTLRDGLESLKDLLPTP
jgi:hypothetical protein